MALVLIIDSDADVADALSNSLNERGVDTQVIADGAEGLKVAKADSPDAIVLCVELSRVSGYSICNKLKKNAALAKIPLILTSDKATEETFEQHKKLKTRAEQYLKKPYALDQMLGLIAQYVDMDQDGAAEVEIDADEDELEVSLDDMDVDIGGDDEDEVGGEFDVAFDEEEEDAAASGRSASGESEFGGVRIAATKVTTSRTSGEQELDIGQDNEEAPAPSRGGRAGASDAQLQKLRDEVKTLRAKVMSLEESLRTKEEEFTDRLLKESTRSREGIELKKKITQMEREIAKHKQAAAKAEQKVMETAAKVSDIKSEFSSADKEKQALTEKVGQLVDKVKSLAAERDELRGAVEELETKQAEAEEEVAAAAQVRARAKKAVDIAMQLLNDTGLVN